MNLDKIIVHWVISKCTAVGAMFALGPLEGALIIVGGAAALILHVTKKQVVKASDK